MIYDLVSVLLWLGPSALAIGWLWRRFRRADRELRARTEANAQVFFAQVYAEHVRKKGAPPTA